MKIKKKEKSTPVGKVKSLITSLFDKEVKGRRKWIILGIILYIVSPIDLVPDFIPAIGYLDDIMVPILLIIAEKLITNDEKTKHAS